jgi:Tfp pilus assembly protein PilF
LNREHALFLLIGLLAGFLGGYLGHESMVAVQPARIAPGGAAALAPAGPAPTPAPSAAAPGAAPAMAEIQQLQEALARDPNDASAVLRLANLNFDIQRWERAAELYERYLSLRPGDADVLTDLGITQRARGDFAGALERFRAAQRLAPDHWQARFNEIVVLAFDQRDLAAARTALSELEKRAPGNADVARLAGEIRRLEDAGE